MAAPENVRIGRAWVRAFNAHDVPALVALYAEDATHISPKIRALHPETGGKLRGKAAIAGWWREAIERLPQLRYEATSFTADEHRVFVEYTRKVQGEPDLQVAEVFEVIAGRIVASRVYHG